MDLRFNTFDIQEGKLGKAFRQSAVSINTDRPSKWMSNVEKWHWIYLFKYVNEDKFFEVEIDYYGKIIKVNKNV